MFDECWADCFRKTWKRRARAEKESRPYCGICSNNDHFVLMAIKQNTQLLDVILRHLELHHKTYRHEGFELSEDLIPLCRSCHALVEVLKIGPRKDSFEIVAELCDLAARIRSSRSSSLFACLFEPSISQACWNHYFAPSSEIAELERMMESTG